MGRAIRVPSAKQHKVVEDTAAFSIPVEEVVEELKAIREDLAYSDENIEGSEDEEAGYIDVRLQVYDSGEWVIHSGDASYDTDHRGSWGAGTVSVTDTDEDLLSLANDLIAQAEDMKAQIGDEEVEETVKRTPSKKAMNEFQKPTHPRALLHFHVLRGIMNSTPEEAAATWAGNCTPEEAEQALRDEFGLTDEDIASIKRSKAVESRKRVGESVDNSVDVKSLFDDFRSELVKWDSKNLTKGRGLHHSGVAQILEALKAAEAEMGSGKTKSVVATLKEYFEYTNGRFYFPFLNTVLKHHGIPLSDAFESKKSPRKRGKKSLHEAADGYAYRLVVGEAGNEQGEVIPLDVDSEAAATRALRKELKQYGGDGWGRVEYCLASDLEDYDDDPSTWRRLGESRKHGMKSLRERASEFENIGSGKLPNKYYVSHSGHFMVASDEGLNWEDSDPKLSSVHCGDPVEDGVYDTFEEALVKAEEVAEGIDKDADDLRNVTIDDHISGQVYSIYLVATPSKWGYDFETETWDETRFTREKLGAAFESKKSPRKHSLRESRGWWKPGDDPERLFGGITVLGVSGDTTIELDDKQKVHVGIVHDGSSYTPGAWVYLQLEGYNSAEDTFAGAFEEFADHKREHPDFAADWEDLVRNAEEADMDPEEYWQDTWEGIIVTLKPSELKACVDAEIENYSDSRLKAIEFVEKDEEVEESRKSPKPGRRPQSKRSIAESASSIPEWVPITTKTGTWYFCVIDPTHVYAGPKPEKAGATPYHVDQLRRMMDSDLAQKIADWAMGKIPSASFKATESRVSKSHAKRSVSESAQGSPFLYVYDGTGGPITAVVMATDMEDATVVAKAQAGAWYDGQENAMNLESGATVAAGEIESFGYDSELGFSLSASERIYPKAHATEAKVSGQKPLIERKRKVDLSGLQKRGTPVETFLFNCFTVDRSKAEKEGK